MTQHLFLGCNGNVSAVDVSSGVELWQTKLKPGVLSATNYADVAVLDHEGKVYAGCNGHLFCLVTPWVGLAPGSRQSGKRAVKQKRQRNRAGRLFVSPPGVWRARWIKD